MLQTENNALRERIKILQETVDGLRVHNIQLLADMEVMKIKAGSSEENGDGSTEGVDDAMASVVKKYVEEIEELRSKLLEAEATHKRSQLRSQASPSRPNTASLSIVGFSGNVHWSQAKTEDDLDALLRDAKRDVERRLALLGLARGHQPQPRGEHDRLEPLAPLAVWQPHPERAVEAHDHGLAKLVAVVGGAVGGVDLDLERRLPHAGSRHSQSAD